MNKLANLERILELAPLSSSRFVTTTLPAAPLGGRGTFGGTLVAQSLLAALYTVPDEFEPVSLHSYFVNSGNTNIPINYHVQDLRHGRNFIHKQVKGFQNEKLIFTSIILFSLRKTAPSLHKKKITDAKSMPHIDDLHRAADLFEKTIVPNAAKYGGKFNDKALLDKHMEQFNQGVMDYRFPDDLFMTKKDNDELGYFVNCRQKVTQTLKRGKYEKITPYNDPRYNYVALAYISDSYFLLTLPHFHGLPLYSHNFSVSLDHSIHFHQLPHINNWLYFKIENPSSRANKHLMEGEYYDPKTAELVASVTQEGFVMYDPEEELRAKF